MSNRPWPIARRATRPARSAVEQADAILLELDKVLQKILELETYNELMNIVRSLIEDQEELIEKTKKEQKQGALDLLK